jgi:hypothetical protein
MQPMDGSYRIVNKCSYNNCKVLVVNIIWNSKLMGDFMGHKIVVVFFCEGKNG